MPLALLTMMQPRRRLSGVMGASGIVQRGVQRSNGAVVEAVKPAMLTQQPRRSMARSVDPPGTVHCPGPGQFGRPSGPVSFKFPVAPHAPAPSLGGAISHR